MNLYMIVTADKYELPLAVRDTVVEIADLLGKPVGDVYSTITRKYVSNDTYNGFRYKIIKINVDDLRVALVAVTADKHERIVAVADTILQMADILGVSRVTVSRAIASGRVINQNVFDDRIKVIWLEIDDEEDDDG